MAAYVPTKPVTGNAIETVWGADMHNRMYTPLTCTGSGAAMTGLTGSEQKMNLSVFSNGYNMVDVANNQLVIPAGGSGMYMAEFCVSLTNMAQAVGNFGRARFLNNGSVAQEGGMMFGMGSSSVGSVITMFYLGTLSDGATFAVNVIPHATIPGDYQLKRFVLTRIANAYGSSPARSLQEVFNPTPSQRAPVVTRGRKSK